MSRLPDDPSIYHEPQYGDIPDVSGSMADRAGESVWDEPGLSPESAGCRRKNADFSDWLEKGRGRWSWTATWLVTLALAVAGGLWAVVGSFLGIAMGPGVLYFVVVGPALEEAMKMAAGLWVVERRPYLFRSAFQILFSVTLSGLSFAGIENLLYLNVYVSEPSGSLALWRWSVCTALHSGCSLLAGVGLVVVWKEVWRFRARPRLEGAWPWYVAATAIHAAYNSLVLAFAMAGYGF